MTKTEMVVDCRNILGEGVTWDADSRRLHWVDIQSSAFWTLDPSTGASFSQKLPERMACFAPRRRGGLVAGFASGFALYDPASGSRQDIAPFEPDKPHTRMNDGRTDRQGRLVAGGFDEVEGKLISSLVRLDADLKLTTLFGGVGCANGICFSPNGTTMYFADTQVPALWAFAYDTATGTPHQRRLIARFDDQPGTPDGACIDADGCVWNAQWNGHRVVRYTPDGCIDRIIEVPVLNPTCVAFGGPGLDTLYITTAQYAMSAEQVAAEPLSGGLFACRPGVTGLPDTKFAG